jgi:hypothetical protein
MSEGNRMHPSSIWRVIAKGCEYLCKLDISVFNFQYISPQKSKNILSHCHYWVFCVEWWEKNYLIHFEAVTTKCRVSQGV